MSVNVRAVLTAMTTTVLVGCSFVRASTDRIVATDLDILACEDGSPWEVFILDASSSDDCDNVGGGSVESHCCCMDGTVQDCVTATGGGSGSAIDGQEDSASVINPVEIIDVLEPDADVTGGSAGTTFELNLELYALRGGRVGGQSIRAVGLSTDSVLILQTGSVAILYSDLTDAGATSGGISMASNGLGLFIGSSTDKASFFGALSEVARVEADGDVQMDGDLEVAGADIHANTTADSGITLKASTGATSAAVIVTDAATAPFHGIFVYPDLSATATSSYAEIYRERINLSLGSGDTLDITESTGLTVKAQFSAAGALQLDGDLTVDGTGTSNFAGDVSVDDDFDVQGDVDFASADTSKPFPSNATLPGTCVEGSTWHDPDSAGCEVYVCVATDRWAKFACQDAGGATTTRGFTGSNSTTINVTNNTLTKGTMDSEVLDSDGFHSTSSDTDRFTIPSAALAGTYLFTAMANWDSNTAGGRGVYFYLNSAGTCNGTFLGGSNFGAGAVASGYQPSTAWAHNLVAGDHVDFCYIQNSGGTRTVQTISFKAVRVLSSGVGIVGDHGVQLAQSGTQSLSDSSETAITFETETVDTDDYHSTVSNTDSIIVPSGLGGQATIVCALEFATNGTGVREARLFKNGSEIDHDIRVALSSDVTTPRVVYHDMAAAQASDYECRGYQTSGGSLNVNSTGTVFAFLMVNADEADVKRDPATDLAYYDKDGSGSIDTDGDEAAMIHAPRFGFEIIEEFHQGWVAVSNEVKNDFFYTAQGTNSDCTVSATNVSAGHPGVAVCDTGTTAGGATDVRTYGSGYLFGGGEWRGEILLKSPSALSSGTQTYEIRAGFNDVALGVGTGSQDGALFYYRHDANGGKWGGYNCNNGTCVAVDTGITFAVDTWYRLSIYVNAAGTSATYCVNGTCVNNTNTLPTAAGREFGFQHSLYKSVGTTVVTDYLDYLWVNWTATTPR